MSDSSDNDDLLHTICVMIADGTMPGTGDIEYSENNSAFRVRASNKAR